jgi:hypothetical protein
MYMCIEFTLARRNNVEVCLNWVYQHLRMLWNTFFSLAMRNSQFASKKKKVKKKRKRLWNHRQQSWYPLARSQKQCRKNTGIPNYHCSTAWDSRFSRKLRVIEFLTSKFSAFHATEWVLSPGRIRVANLHLMQQNEYVRLRKPWIPHSWQGWDWSGFGTVGGGGVRNKTLVSACV